MFLVQGKSYLCLKRLIDITGSGAVLLILSPLLCFVAWNVKKNLGSPVFFTQDRPGLHGKIFKMCKFRSMRDACDAQGRPLSDAERLTDFGKKLRSTSLDELPELWNVLKGDMSIVGPRPLLVQYLPLYNEHQRHRHDVKPGITGWAQIHGRNAISWEEKFNYDVWYAEHVSLWLDLKILWKTVAAVLRREGISAAGCDTMPEFRGNTSA